MKFILRTFIVLCLFVFTGCAETKVENNIRVLVEGRVADAANLPLENATINIFTDANSPGALPVLLGQDITDDDGVFSVTSLFGTNEIFEIDIFLSDGYTSYTYVTSTLDYRPSDLIFDLGTVSLSQISTFNYSIIKESTTTSSFSFTLTYLDSDCLEIFYQGNLDEDLSSCYESRFISKSLNVSSPDAQGQLLIPFNSTIQFTYSVDGGEELTQQILIDQLLYDFEISY